MMDDDDDDDDNECIERPSTHVHVHFLQAGPGEQQ